MSRAPASARLLRLCAAAALAPAAQLGAQTTYTWSDLPTNNDLNNAANWSGGTAAPSGSIVVFGESTITNLSDGGRLNWDTLRIESTAQAPYTFTTGLGFIFTGQGVVNQSAYRPTFHVAGRLELITTTGSLGDGIFFHDFSTVTTTNLFRLRGSAGTSTLHLKTISFIGIGGDGRDAEFVLYGNTLQQSNSADLNPLNLGSLRGTGTVAATGAAISVGHRGDDTSFSGNLNTLVAASAPGAARVVKTGTGTFTLTGGAINAADGLHLEAGALVIGADARLGTTTNVTLNGGALRYGAAFADLRALTLGATGGGLDTQGFNITHSTGISGAGPLKKLGTGTLTLAAANTHSGGTHASTGTLALGHDQALGTGALVLDGGNISASGGPRVIANSVTLQADAAFTGSQALTVNGAFTLARNREFTVSASAPLTLSGGITQSGGPRTFARYGTGELVLTGASTYTGGTLLAEGLTRINNTSGSAFGTGAVTLSEGATLTGAGSFSGAFQNNGTYAPGNSPTLATLSSFTQGETGILEMELAGTTRGTGYDALNITGSFAPGGTLRVLLIDGFSPLGGESFDLFNWGSVTGTFADLILPSLTPGLSWDASALYTTGVLSVIGSPIPEPASAAVLVGFGALALAATRRRRA